MTARLTVPKHACATCPYRRATPPGVWHPDEYLKLPRFDDLEEPLVATFHCHQEHHTGIPTVCLGWLRVHPDSIAVRVAQITGQIDQADVTFDAGPEFYSSGAEACAAGLAAVFDPPPEAVVASAKLIRRGGVTT